MDPDSPAMETTLVSSTVEPRDRALCTALERYVSGVVSREVETAQAQWAAHSTLTDEEAAILRELAEAIAAEVVTEPVRMAVRADPEDPSTNASDERRDRIASLFDLRMDVSNGEAPSPVSE